MTDLTRLFYLIVLSLIVSNASSASAVKSEVETFKVDLLAEGLGIPWGMAFVDEQQLLITERRGAVKHLDLKTGKLTEIDGVPAVHAQGQAGMLDVAVPPDYKPGDWIYFTFARSLDGEGATVLARARLNGKTLEQWQDVLQTRSANDTPYHYGSRIAFDAEGHVYFGVGDRGHRPNGQDLSNHAASVMRLKRNGEVPADNPFVGKTNALPEIWSYGHRNPQGIAYDYENKRLWLIEHGPRGGDEINLVLPGRNYGWPVISYGKEYTLPIAVGEGTEREGMEQPVKYYVPSIAPGSLLYYTGKAFPNWQGNLFAGALKLQHINRVTLDDNGKAVGEERLLGDMQERIRSMAQSPEGWLLFATDNGRIYAIKPAS